MIEFVLGSLLIVAGVLYPSPLAYLWPVYIAGRVTGFFIGAVRQ